MLLMKRCFFNIKNKINYLKNNPNRSDKKFLKENSISEDELITWLQTLGFEKDLLDISVPLDTLREKYKTSIDTLINCKSEKILKDYLGIHFRSSYYGLYITKTIAYLLVTPALTEYCLPKLKHLPPSAVKIAEHRIQIARDKVKNNT